MARELWKRPKEALNKCSSFPPVAKATLILLDLRHG